MVTHTFCMRKTMTFLYQHKDVTEIENVLNNKFASVWEWFVDNKLSVHFAEDNNKCILLREGKTCQSLT